MAVRELVKDPETGKPALVKVSYEVLEMEIFEQAVVDAQDDYDVAKKQYNEAKLTFETSGARLTETKSELELAQEVVADTEPGSDVDEEEDGDGGEVEDDESGVAQVA